ncbi:hypothetical protein B0I37DRAFT_364877 [Chaetomium sp. MPI-CAGE-AT-0009]|nr:hypothetical protein B0I37DRAFT_364877 [Chaetomium sp. MPI-CAGE-AT-0009]
MGQGQARDSGPPGSPVERVMVPSPTACRHTPEAQPYISRIWLLFVDSNAHETRNNHRYPSDGSGWGVGGRGFVRPKPRARIDRVRADGSDQDHGLRIPKTLVFSPPMYLAFLDDASGCRLTMAGASRLMLTVTQHPTAPKTDGFRPSLCIICSLQGVLPPPKSRISLCALRSAGTCIASRRLPSRYATNVSPPVSSVSSARDIVCREA